MVKVGFVVGRVIVRLKPVLPLEVPSLTVTVIVAVPVCPTAGVTVTVRFAPLPPKTMLAGGTNPVVTDSFTAADPLFVNATSGDFHLQSGSPAVGFGRY